MNTTHIQFQQAFEKLPTLTVPEKIKFLESLLFYFTISGRAIWSDEDNTDLDKLDALRWLNELTHRVWNIYFNVKSGNDPQFATELYDHCKFYGEQSKLLSSQLVPTILAAFNRL